MYEHRGNPVAFRLFPSMPDVIRYLLAAVFLIGGFLVQLDYTMQIPGLVMLLIASLLLMFKGIDRRIFKYSLSERVDWVKTSHENISQMLQITRDLKKWDRNPFEVSNATGCLLFIIMAVLTGLLLAFNVHLILILDVAALFVPLFLSGMLKVDMNPPVITKTENILTVIPWLKSKNNDYEYSFYTLLAPVKDKKKPVPTDIKIKITPYSSVSGFLGIYGQCNLNRVGSTTYPYMYFVMVYGKEFNLKEKVKKLLGSSDNITREYSETGDANVLIIRQTTTKTSGYHTKPKDIIRLLHYTIKIYESALV